MVDKSPHPKGCWLWTGSGQRYGKMKIRGVNYSTHRLGYAIQKGTIPDGMHVMHSCDVKRCCNGDHLSLGTEVDNMQDLARKGYRQCATGDAHGMRKHPHRVPRGMAQPNARFTDDDIRSIRAAYAAGGVTQQQLGTKYGVRQTHIGKIIRREIWPHVD